MHGKLEVEIREQDFFGEVGRISLTCQIEFLQAGVTLVDPSV
jgi:hypothetical protein